MKLNPNALVFWAFCGLVGYLIGGVTAALIGLAIALGISLFFALFTR